MPGAFGSLALRVPRITCSWRIGSWGKEDAWEGGVLAGKPGAGQGQDAVAGEFGPVSRLVRVGSRIFACGRLDPPAAGL